MHCYSYERSINISIYENFAELKMQHILHPIQINISILPEIKIFILYYIDLLSCKIYK